MKVPPSIDRRRPRSRTATPLSQGPSEFTVPLATGVSVLDGLGVWVTSGVGGRAGHSSSNRVLVVGPVRDRTGVGVSVAVAVGGHGVRVALSRDHGVAV